MKKKYIKLINCEYILNIKLFYFNLLENNLQFPDECDP